MWYKLTHPVLLLREKVYNSEAYAIIIEVKGI